MPMLIFTPLYDSTIKHKHISLSKNSNASITKKLHLQLIKYFKTINVNLTNNSSIYIYIF